MKVVVLGSSGMLGGMVKDVLSHPKYNLEVHSFDRSTLSIVPRNLNALGSLLTKLCGHDADYVINCIGAIKPSFQNKTNNIGDLVYTNAVFPHQLALWGSLMGAKVIHITTDCVYSGAKGQYVETDIHDALDAYGKSKSLGEPKNAMVIRTSIIGPEFGGRKKSFLEWVRSQREKEINGFTNHFWNGLTTLELARCLSDIIRDSLWAPNIYHTFSNKVTKYDMVDIVNYKYNLGIKINPASAPSEINRTLDTNKLLNDKLRPQSFEVMVDELVEWENAHADR